MILLPLLLALQTTTIHADPGDAPPVPDAVKPAYAAYLTCLMMSLDPLSDGAAAADRAAAAATVKQALADCHRRRVAVAAEMEAGFPRTGGFADPARRRARIEEILDKAEQRLAFTTIEPDAFRAIVADLTRCWNAGRGDACKPAKAPK